jgi:DNA modification methylase
MASQTRLYRVHSGSIPESRIMTEGIKILNMDALEGLRSLPSDSVDCCVTSPPYWGLRDYGHEGQLGLEPTAEEYIDKMVEIFHETMRVLTPEGTLWLNLGDSYTGSKNDGKPGKTSNVGNTERGIQVCIPKKGRPKNLVGIPWRVALALQSDGWYLRQDIIWHKSNAMPESVTDRCTKSHEYIFLLTKSPKYYFDSEAIQEPILYPRARGMKFGGNKYPGIEGNEIYSGNEYDASKQTGKNKRSVWSIPTKPYKGAHFAVMPPDLVKPCILAGCPKNGTVLDPFAGSGTTLSVAVDLGRNAIGIELNPDYIPLIHKRLGVFR